VSTTTWKYLSERDVSLKACEVRAVILNVDIDFGRDLLDHPRVIFIAFEPSVHVQLVLGCLRGTAPREFRGDEGDAGQSENAGSEMHPDGFETCSR
jgi:hypothetical protein